MGSGNRLEHSLENNTGKKINEGDSPKDKTHLKFGIIAGASLIVLFMVFYAKGVGPGSGIVAWIPPIVFMLLILISQFIYAQKVEETTFGNIFAQGFKTAAVAICIFIGFLILLILLDPAYKESIMEVNRQAIAKLGKADMDKLKTTAEQLKEQLSNLKAHFMLYQVRSTVLKELVLGLIASIVGAAVAPKNKKLNLDPLN